jgi:hypothetical protein
MLKTLLYAFSILAAFVIVGAVGTMAISFSLGPPAASTGLIGESSCNQGGCHSNTLNSGTITNTLSLGVADMGSS